MDKRTRRQLEELHTILNDARAKVAELMQRGTTTTQYIAGDAHGHLKGLSLDVAATIAMD